MNTNNPIVTSLLDTDLYKFTMQQVVHHQFPDAEARYLFRCRNQGVDLTPIAGELQKQVQSLADLKFADDELAYLGKLSFIKPDYVAFLRDYRLKPELVSIDVHGGELGIAIQGPWVQTILFEIPLLSLVNELYFRHTATNPDYAEGNARLRQKVEQIKTHPDAGNFRFADFGTRRRFSRQWQEEIVSTLKGALPGKFIGTSNVDLARRYQLIPIGTMAHEYLQAFQAFVNPLESQKAAFESWVQEYRGNLGIALTDVIGIEAFLNDLDLYFAKLFDGFRHDSGDPVEWGYKIIARLKQLRVDPLTKTAVFSDGLTVPKALEIYDEFKGKIQTSFGIGTNLTNDLGYKPLNIVIKMIDCNGRPVAKLSDSPGKIMCQDMDYVQYLAKQFKRDLGAIAA
jgi:nicotinate phosphoribosyltransferase